MIIRAEQSDDRGAIHALVAEAFGRPQEARLIDALRQAGDLTISRVAGIDGEICGHVALSRLRSPERALALAPVAVSAPRRRQGIASALIRDGLGKAPRLGFAMAVVLGDPAFYCRFGFTAEAALPFPCRYSGAYFMALQLTSTASAPAPVIFADAFDTLD
jgi:putative acetyltransferase